MTLIEIMVALVIALFLIAVIASVVFGFRSSFSTQGKLAQIQETEKFTLNVLNNTLRSSGYYPSPLTLTATTAFPASTINNPDGTAFTVGQTIIGATTSGKDSLNVRISTNSGEGISNCQGDTNTSGARVVWVNSFLVNPSNQFTCTVNTNSAAFGDAVILTDNVASMTVLYGVDSDQDGSADVYLNAPNVTNWGLVASLRISLTLIDLVNSRPGVAVNLPNPIVHTINLMNKL